MRRRDESGTEPATDFQTEFWAAKRAIANAWSAAFARHGIHSGQQFVLQCLWETDGLSPGEVAKRLGLATPTVTKATARMEAAGLLRREPHPSDRRLVRLVLTDKGRGLEKAIGKELDKLERRALASLNERERTALITGLRAVAQNLRG
jgi:MarR family transcriptional regulator, organic hydroperoxide resistance regulator